jgi:hypothetical protein
MVITIGPRLLHLTELTVFTVIALALEKCVYPPKNIAIILNRKYLMRRAKLRAML